MTFSNTPLKGKSIAELEFLTGHWKGKAGDDIIEEYWLPEVEGNKACVFRWIKSGEIYVYEIVALKMKNDEIHMLLRHFDKDFVAWEEKNRPRDFVVSELSESDVVFVDSSNPEKGFLRYDAEKENILEFFDYDSDGSIQFNLVFQKIG